MLASKKKKSSLVAQHVKNLVLLLLQLWCRLQLWPGFEPYLGTSTCLGHSKKKNKNSPPPKKKPHKYWLLCVTEMWVSGMVWPRSLDMWSPLSSILVLAPLSVKVTLESICGGKMPAIYRWLLSRYKFWKKKLQEKHGSDSLVLDDSRAHLEPFMMAGDLETN